MQKLIFIAPLIALLSLVISCATARVVSVEPGEGGQIAVAPQNSEDARAKATAIMEQNCGGRRFKIVKEAEEVVGKTTHAQVSSGETIWGRPALQGVSTTHDRTEWRLTYKCLTK